MTFSMDRSTLNRGASLRTKPHVGDEYLGVHCGYSEKHSAGRMRRPMKTEGIV